MVTGSFCAGPRSSALPCRQVANPRSFCSHSQDSDSVPSQTLQREIPLVHRKPAQGRPGRLRSRAVRRPAPARPLPHPGLPLFPFPGIGASGGAVPGAESACLFKRPRGAPCETPRAGGGGHGRGRLAPGGRGSRTKLRPLSLRIGRAQQTGGGRALSSPSLSQAPLGPGVWRARASRPPVHCTCSVRSALPAIRKSGTVMGRVVPRSGAWLGCPLVLGPVTFGGVRAPAGIFPALAPAGVLGL